MELKNDEFYMAMAMELAREAAAEGETPVGAVVVRNDGFIAGTGRNRREKGRNALYHAEVIALMRRAGLLAAGGCQGARFMLRLNPALCAQVR